MSQKDMPSPVMQLKRSSCKRQRSKLTRKKGPVKQEDYRKQFLYMSKMLAVMEASQGVASNSSVSNAPPTPDSTTHAQEFLSTGRTGRRNALPDILSQHTIQVSSSDLPSKFQGLSTSEQPGGSQDQPGTSKS